MNKLLLGILFLISINFSSIHWANCQKLTRLYKKNNGNKIISQDSVEYFVKVGVRIDPKITFFKGTKIPKKIYINELSDRGQEALIEQYGNKLNIQNLNKSLSTPLVEKPLNNSLNKEFTKYLVHIEFDVDDTKSSSAINFGRIIELQLRLSLNSNDEIRFYSFKEFNTIYEYVNFGDIEETRTRNFTLNAGFELQGTGATSTQGSDSNTTDVTSTQTSNVGASYGSVRSTTEKISQLQRIISQMGTMGDNNFSILQQGAPKNNLEGKISLDLVVETQNNLASSYFSFADIKKDNKFQDDPSKIKVNRYFITTPIIKNDITAEVACKFEYREINNEKGRRTKSEHDDIITTRAFSDYFVIENNITLLKKNELKDLFHYWVIVDGNQDPKKQKIIYINYYGENVELRFDSMIKAMEFLEYLRETKSTTLGNSKIKVGQRGAIEAIDIKNENFSKYHIQISKELPDDNK